MSIDAVQSAVRAALGAGSGLFGVACSGGADSMALADGAIAVAKPHRVIVLVIDHGLNPRSAEVGDGVAAWARTRGAACVVRRVEVLRRASIEAAARDARYAALDQLAQELGLSVILVGHTARDQAETVLMRIIRGTGPAGLSGIPRRRVIERGDGGTCTIARPLLHLDRTVIDQYIAERQLPTWNDPMNADRTIARVRMREDILPMLRRENPQLDAALVRLATSASEWAFVIDAVAQPFGRFPIDCIALAAQPAAVRKRAIAIALEAAGAGYDATHLDAVDQLVASPTHGERALDLAGGRFVRTYDQARFEPTGTSVAESVPLTIPKGCEVRIWQAGDRMRPQRLGGQSRKLSDLFADAKVPRQERASARVIVRVHDTAIVWAEHLGIAHDSVVSDEERGKLWANPA